MLESRLNHSPDDEAVKALQLLTRDLESLKDTLTELNQVCKIHGPASEVFKIKEVFASLRVLLQNHLRGIQLTPSGEMSLYAPKSICTSVLMNLVLNSAEAFKEHPCKNPRIDLVAEGNSLIIQDNAGGFPPAVIEAVSRNEFVSTREKGSGLGLLFVYEEMTKLGGKVQISNTQEGARVRLTFPRALVRTSI
jgi:signal transduction histidine kinase